ncbi:EutP/PduV family microcompartment system protein [Enterococcus sp.]|uniref:EutP/PduV family microcompartment system protein n=1 Tax=Enterococcus sp. TaxID=35783 RepID=UPI0025C697D7|nr:EutP/PduV family microcompartment system protein [Enterococcus sp.]
MKKRILIVGVDDDENRKVAQTIEATNQPIRKLANLLYTNKTILVPSAYLECPWMHKHIIALQQEASEVLFLVSLNNKKRYPPGFARVFQVPRKGGIVSHGSRQAKKTSEQAERELMEIGCMPPYQSIVFEESNVPISKKEAK